MAHKTLADVRAAFAEAGRVHEDDEASRDDVAEAAWRAIYTAADHLGVPADGPDPSYVGYA